MAIVFHCECGRPLRASPEAAGKKTKCPGCGHMLTIPGGPAKPAVAATTKAAIEEDPFAPTLDWSSIESPKAEAEGRAGSGHIKIDAAQADHAEVDPPRPEDGSRQYRVLAHKEQGVVGKFTASRLEDVLNAHARRGWCLKAAVVIDLPGHGGNHAELVVILER